MERYKDLNGDSCVEGYIIGDDYIVVKFTKTAKTYKYSYSSAGNLNVEKMKILARKGDGLNAFINTNVKNLFEK